MDIPIIAPSILAADFANLGRDIEMLNESEAGWIHVDVMDGMFVPNISFGIPVLAAVRKLTTKFVDVHLMIEQPERYVEAFFQAGANQLTVHYEACRHLHRNIQQIKDLGCKAGVALNPHTPVSLLKEVLADLDLVLVMSVNPGFGGQSFIPGSLRKIRELRDLIESTGSKALIEVDGGVNNENAARLVDAGVNVLVAGSAVFSAEDPAGMIQSLKSI